jgi:CBS domain containing-hemolysin-like protein
MGLVMALVFVVYARGALADFSLTRLDRYCVSRRPDRCASILALRDRTISALTLWSWICFLGALALLWYGGRDADQETWQWLDRLLIVWLAFVGLQFWWGRQPRKRHVEAFLFWTWPLLSVLRMGMAPVLYLTAALERAWLSNVGGAAGAPRRGATSVAAAPRTVGIPAESSADMLNRVMELPNITVSDIMTPRTDMVTLKSTTTLEEARQIISKCGHSRIPVYGENRDDIRGILYAKDLLPHFPLARDMPADLTSLRLRDALYVPEAKPVDVLLREFQHGKVHIALVLDEYGGVAGLVTIEDILEQIVGEIVDEHDPHEIPPIRQISSRVFEVDARVHVDELNARIPLDLPEDAEYDTVGGFVFSVLGRIPKPGESVRHEHAVLTVMDASDRLIRRVRVELEVEDEQIHSSSA